MSRVVSHSSSPLATVPASPVPLRWGEIHLWPVSLSRDERDYTPLLSAYELERADEFRFPKDRRRYIVARGNLRRILASYAGREASHLQIRTAPRGKPYLESSDHSVQFNVAHSGDRALIAIAADRSVGVDLEDLRHLDRLRDLVQVICTQSEQDLIQTLLPPQVPLALLRLWTAKEAFLKAIGCGLDVHPASINVPPAVLRGDPRFSEIGWTESPEAAATFMLIPLPRCEQTLGASAALVVSRNGSIPHITWCDVTSTGRAG